MQIIHAVDDLQSFQRIHFTERAGSNPRVGRGCAEPFAYRHMTRTESTNARLRGASHYQSIPSLPQSGFMEQGGTIPRWGEAPPSRSRLTK